MADPHSQNFGYPPAVNPQNNMHNMPGGAPMYPGPHHMTGPSVAPRPYKEPAHMVPPPGPPSMPKSSTPVANLNQMPPHSQSMGPGPGQPPYGAMPPGPGMPRPQGMQGPHPSSGPHSQAPPTGMPPQMLPGSTGHMGGVRPGPPQMMGGPNTMPPKPGMMPPPMVGAPPTPRPMAPAPPMVNGVPSSQPNFNIPGGQPPRPFLNGPPTSGQNLPGAPPTSMNGPPMRPGIPQMGPLPGGGPRPSMPPGHTPPPGQFVGQRPPQMGPMAMPPRGLPPQGPPPMTGGSLLPGGLPAPPRMTTNGPPGQQQPGQHSEPVSQKSSRAPSPTPGANYDALEGGQPAWSPGAGPPPGGAPMGMPPGQPPMPGQQMGQPPQQPGYPGMTAGGMPPPPQDMQRMGGITGKRHYPQMPGMNTQVPPPPPMSGAQPGQMPGMMNNTMAGQPPVQPQPPYMPTGQPQYVPNNTNNGPTNNMVNNVNNLGSSFNNMKLGAQPVTTPDRPINLMAERGLMPPDGFEDMKPNLPHDYKKANVSPDIFRATLTNLPQSQALLSKCRLPLGILIHPFKDLSQLPVIQSSVIVRCKSCRTYINPFVTFVDMRRWKCNLCYRVNELPDEFNYDPVSKTYGDPQRRPEIRSATIEFIAPSEYMLRPPQPAVYLYVLDVSFNAVSTGYLSTFCQALLDEMDRIPGDSRTQIGFITFDSSLHFYNLSEGLSQPQMLVVSDVDDVFLPCPDSLLVNLHESKELITELLNQLPSMFENTMDTGNALGAALQAAYKLMGAAGGRVSVFQTQLPSVGPGALKNREDPNERAGKKVQHLGPATDFYKKMSLDCSAQQIAVDLFMMSSQYSDLASVACISKYSGGCVHYFPGLHATNNPAESDRLEGTLRRYFTRKIGFEAVMRIRCTRGLAIHTFHGNFFVRSTDLLSLPNINPDAGFGMQMSIEDTLETNTACFQAALLYTSSKGERRIRVHTLCLPVTNSLTSVYAGADQLAIVGLLGKMAVDKCVSQSLSDARDAVINASIDMLRAYGQTLAASQRIGQLPVCYTLRAMPLYCIAMLKYLGFRLGTSTKLDDRVFALEQCKTLPLCHLLLELYPALYPVHALDDKNALSKGDSQIPQPGRIQLSSAHIDRHGAYIMDAGNYHCLWVGGAISDRFCQEVFDVPNYASVQDGLMEIPELENPTSDRLRSFISHLNDQRPYPAGFYVIKDDSRHRMMFLQHMIEDRTESTMSYYEFLQHLQKEVKS